MKNIRFFIGLLFLSLLTACQIVEIFSSPTSTPTPINTLALTPTPTITPSPTITPTPTEDPIANVTFNNDTGNMICAIFMYAEDFSGQPENYVENQLMMTGTSIEVSIEKGEYIVEVWDCQMNQLHNLYGFVIEGDFEWDLSEVPDFYTYEAQQLIMLVNERAWDICEFYIRSADSDNWGENHFHPAYDYYLSAGSTLFEEIEPGVYDFKLVYCDGTVASTQEDVEVPEGQNMTWTLTP